MERWMIVYLLPLEVWMDIFCYPWIKRKDFGQLIDKIGNFKFAEHAQFYLHEWGKHGIGQLEFKQNGLHKRVWNEQIGRIDSVPVDFPQTQMPEKISSFERIEIQHFDANTIDFLAEIRPLLTNVGIDCKFIKPEHLENTRTALTRLAPMLGGINWLDCNDSTLPLLWQCFPREKLDKTKWMGYYCLFDKENEALHQANANTIMDWLTAAPAEGLKMFTIDPIDCDSFAKQICTTIRQQFLQAKTPHTFAVSLTGTALADFRLENGIGEQLHGKWIQEDEPAFQIIRHKAELNTKEWQEWMKQMTSGLGHGSICFENLTIGPLSAAQEDTEEMEPTAANVQVSAFPMPKRENQMEHDGANRAVARRGQKKVYVPGMSRTLKESEELVYDSKAYLMLHTFETDLPCLSFDILPDSLGDNRQSYPMTAWLASGTQHRFFPSSTPSMERWMIIYLLPLEVWMDIFCYPWIKRKHFGQLIDKIGNFKFAEHAQFYLHEWGKHGMGQLDFNKNGLHKITWNGQTKQIDTIRVDFPLTQMPEKIASFDRIEIRHFDANTLDFFAKIRPLLTNVWIDCKSIGHEQLENTRTALTSLAPLVDGIHLLACNDLTLPMAWQCFPPEQLAKIKVLGYVYYEVDEAQLQANANIIMDWLTAAPADGPKMCEVKSDRFDNYVPIITAIREQFLRAKTPHTFAVNLGFDFFWDNPLPSPEQQFHETNGIGEVLHGELSAERDFQITRHPADGNTKEILEWIEQVTRGEGGCIRFENPTFGSPNSAQEDKEEMEPTAENLEEVEQQKPCSSKDA